MDETSNEAVAPFELDLGDGYVSKAELRDEASARVLGKLIQIASLVGTMEELRTKLGLDDMSMKLFKYSCWFLSEGVVNPALIVFHPVGSRERGRRNGHRLFEMHAIRS